MNEEAQRFLKVFLTGGTGFVGSRLIPFLLEQGAEVHVLLRDNERDWPVPGGVSTSVGDPMRPGPWWDPVAGCQAAINLAGYPVFSRWNARTKELIRDSRLATTHNLVAAIPPGVKFRLVSASGIGIYGDQGEEQLDESAELGDDFLAGTATAWEEAAFAAREREARVATARFGIIFGPDGGALPQLIRVTRIGIGGPLGGGRQWMPWIHREDAVRALWYLVQNPELKGPFNFSAPHPERQAAVARILGRLLHRPAFVPAPALVMRLILGECAAVALFSQNARPRRLLDAGYEFLYPQVEPALREILGLSR